MLALNNPSKFTNGARRQARPSSDPHSGPLKIFMKHNESWRLVEYQALVDSPEVVVWLRLQDELTVHWDEQYQGFWILALSPIDTWLHLKGI